jgi:hypothetical protein
MPSTEAALLTALLTVTATVMFLAGAPDGGSLSLESRRVAMRTRSLIGILALLCVGWLFVLGPAVLEYSRILRNADGYRRAEFLVTGQNCIGGERSPRYCFLQGKVTVEGAHPGFRRRNVR